MKKQETTPLWTQETPNICRFCAFAKRFGLTEDIYCEKKKNFLKEDYSCRKFKYDILKKDVRRRKFRIPKHDASEFEI